MSYTDQNLLFRSIEGRGRFEMCIREQGFIFSADGRPSIRALGMGVVGGDGQSIDALIAAIVTGPNWATLDQDPALLAAVQYAWPTVAAALHPLVADE
jgi:hypothetical protein